jgi:hypothetical protein
VSKAVTASDVVTADRVNAMEAASEPQHATSLRQGMSGRLRAYLPILTWGAEYSGRTLVNDVSGVAGLSGCAGVKFWRQEDLCVSAEGWGMKASRLAGKLRGGRLDAVLGCHARKGDQQ